MKGNGSMKSRISAAFALLALALAGCAADRQAKTVTVGDPDYEIWGFYMTDARHGWAHIVGHGMSLLSTSDGGETWRDVTPAHLSSSVVAPRRSLFRDGRTAWVPIRNTNSEGMLRTTDGGKSWLVLNQTNTPIIGESGDCHFYNLNFGAVSTSDGGLGSSYVTFFQTHDGGKTWTLIPLTPPRPDPNQTNTFHLSNLGGDRIAFFPPSTIIITYGDMVDEQPKGMVRFSVSVDSGKTWRETRLPLPEAYRNRLCAPIDPVFLDKRNIVLVAHIFEEYADASQSNGSLIFYSSTDGGASWVTNPGIIHLQQQQDPNSLNLISPKCFIIQNGGKIWITRDAAQTWQSVTPNIAFGKGTPREINKVDFVDPMHGWIITWEYGKTSRDSRFGYYRTRDGGKTWVELPVRIFVDNKVR